MSSDPYGYVEFVETSATDPSQGKAHHRETLADVEDGKRGEKSLVLICIARCAKHASQPLQVVGPFAQRLGD
jgi:hypothetical protein